MKFIKFAMVIIFIFVMIGCGTAAKESDFFEHDTMYKNWGHLQFSWSGHNSPTIEDVEKSSGQKWWGKDIPVENVK